MARENSNLVYPESKLAIARSLAHPGQWEVLGLSGFRNTKISTDHNSERGVLERTFADNGVLQLTTSGAKARLAAVFHSVTLGLITPEAGVLQTAKLMEHKTKH